MRNKIFQEILDEYDMEQKRDPIFDYALLASYSRGFSLIFYRCELGGWKYQVQLTLWKYILIMNFWKIPLPYVYTPSDPVTDVRDMERDVIYDVIGKWGHNEDITGRRLMIKSVKMWGYNLRDMDTGDEFFMEYADLQKHFEIKKSDMSGMKHLRGTLMEDASDMMDNDLFVITGNWGDAEPSYDRLIDIVSTDEHGYHLRDIETDERFYIVFDLLMKNYEVWRID